MLVLAGSLGPPRAAGAVILNELRTAERVRRRRAGLRVRGREGGVRVGRRRRRRRGRGYEGGTFVAESAGGGGALRLGRACCAACAGDALGRAALCASARGPPRAEVRARGPPRARADHRARPARLF